MSTIEYNVAIPENLAREAESAGLKIPESFELLLREEVKRRRIERLFSTAERIVDLNIPPMTDEEIQAEVDAVRRARAHAPGT